MTRRPRYKTAGTLLRSLYMWHRWLGLAAVAFLLVLAVTGLALNHTEELHLDERFVQSPALLDWYGIHAPVNITTYDAEPLTVSSVGNRIYTNSTGLPGAEPPLLGAVTIDGFVIVAAGNALWLLTVDGEPVERLDGATGVPAGIEAIGTTDGGRLLVRTPDGSYVTDIDFTRWQAADGQNAAWSSPVTPDGRLVAELQQAWRGDGLPLERVMLDLHSGRILGNAGVWLMDTVAILCLLLGASGVWLWVKRRISARAHQRKIRARDQENG